MDTNKNPDKTPLKFFLAKLLLHWDRIHRLTEMTKAQPAQWDFVLQTSSPAKHHTSPPPVTANLLQDPLLKYRLLPPAGPDSPEQKKSQVGTGKYTINT